MPGDAGEVDPPRVVPVGERDDHPHRRGRGDLVAVDGVPGGRVDDRRAAADLPAVAVEEPLDRRDAGLAERRVVEVHPVELAPRPPLRVARLAPGELVAGVDHAPAAGCRRGSRPRRCRASSHHGPAGLRRAARSPPRTTGRRRRARSARAGRRGRSARGALRHTTLKYAAGALSAGWVKSQSRSRSWASR